MMPEPHLVVTIVLVFVLGGMVKGVIGLGLPTVSLALLSVAIDLPSAMVLLIVPSLVTNLWQASVGGHAKLVLQRLWPFLVMATFPVWLGALALTRVQPSLLSGLLGVLLVAYSVSGLSGFRLVVSRAQEPWVGPVLGAANGILTGMTGSFVVPGVMFLQAIGLPRDHLVQAMGMLFTLSALALALALRGNGLLGAELGLLSVAAVLPAVSGMWIGQRLRRRLSEERFRRVFFVALLALGGWIVAGAIRH